MIDDKGRAVNARTNIGLHRFAILLSCMTVVLLGAGALVTSNEAGDSVPDWPFSFGRWLISSNHFVANVRFEYSHRVIAGVVGMTTLLLAVWAQLGERRSWVKKLAWIAFVGVVLQAGIGGVRVLLPEYKALIAVPHALIAQSFFAVVIAIAVFTSRSWFVAHVCTVDCQVCGTDGMGVGRTTLPQTGQSTVQSVGLRKLAAASVIAVLIQLVLGAGFRHQAFGIIPHIIGAIAVTLLIISTVVAVLSRHGKDSYLARPAKTAFGLLMTQVCLGVAVYFARVAAANDPQPLEPMISLTVAHLVVGALTLATTVLLALRSFQVLSAESDKAVGSVSTIHSSARRAAV